MTAKMFVPELFPPLVDPPDSPLLIDTQDKPHSYSSLFGTP